MRVLLVEDDTLLAKATARGLDQAGFIVDIAETAERAAHFAAAYEYQAILLDLGLPDQDGITLLKTLRPKQTSTAILILTAHDQVHDRIQGLETGADDFIIKPYDIHEVKARISAVLRRISGHVENHIKYRNITVNKSNKEVLLNGTSVNLTKSEFHVLVLLLNHQNKIVSKNMIEDSFYASDEEINSNVIQVHIYNLRKKLGKDIIRTVQGFGYIIDSI